MKSQRIFSGKQIFIKDIHHTRRSIFNNLLFSLRFFLSLFTEALVARKKNYASKSARHRQMHFLQLERLARELFPGRISQHKHSSIIAVALPFLDLTIAKSLFKSVQNEDFFAHRDLFFGGHISMLEKFPSVFRLFPRLIFRLPKANDTCSTFQHLSCDNFSPVTFIPKVFFRITNVCLC